MRVYFLKTVGLLFNLLVAFKAHQGVALKEENLTSDRESPTIYKGPVKLMQRVKIAHSVLLSVSNLFHFIILSLPM